MGDEKIRHLLTRAIGILQRSRVDCFDSDAADVVVTESLEALKSYKHSEMKPDVDLSFINTIEVYDDLIRYNGKPIWNGAPYRKSPEEVDAIVKAYELAQTKTTED